MPEQSILIADDQEENQYILNWILRAAGYQCPAATTGAEALALAQKQPDLIILDVRLPDITGFDVCKQLKNVPRPTSIPVLQVSAAFVFAEDRVRALDGSDKVPAFYGNLPQALVNLSSKSDLAEITGQLAHLKSRAPGD